MLVGQRRVGVQEALHHHQVPGDALRVRAPERPQFAPRGGLQLRGLDVVGNAGLGDPVALGGTGAARARATVAPVTLEAPITGSPGASPAIVAGAVRAAIRAVSSLRALTVAPSAVAVLAAPAVAVAPVAALARAVRAPLAAPVIITGAVVGTALRVAPVAVIAMIALTIATLMEAAGTLIRPVGAALRTPITEAIAAPSAEAMAVATRTARPVPAFVPVIRPVVSHGPSSCG